MIPAHALQRCWGVQYIGSGTQAPERHTVGISFRSAAAFLQDNF